MLKFFCTLSLAVLISCDLLIPTPATPQQKQEVMDKAVFNQAIVATASDYARLKDFLLTYHDTIMAYRNSRNSDYVEYRVAIDTVLRNDVCYYYFQGNSSYDITNVPDFLKNELARIYNAFGDNSIQFAICQDRAIRITVTSEYRSHGLLLSHDLLWNAEMKRDEHYAEKKDTMLNGGCIYRIGLSQNYGH